jgi:hypothetical protein
LAGRHTKLTPDVQQRILSYIRGGAFEWVAAEAAGIGKSTFYRWLQEGEAADSGSYHDFWLEVRKARAQSRVAAEAEVRRDNPLAWLRYGPGRQRPDEPGWTESHEIAGPDAGPLEIRAIDYRTVLAPLAPRKVGDLEGQGEDDISRLGQIGDKSFLEGSSASIAPSRDPEFGSNGGMN